MYKHLIVFSLIIIGSQNLLADSARFKIFKENSKKRAVISNRKSTSVFYENPAWNLEATSPETGYMYIRDQKTGKLIELKLTETEPNSSVFNVDLPIGTFKQKKVYLEVYSAPQSMLKGKDRFQTMEKLIKDQAVRRKPILLRVLRKKGQIIDIFEDKENAIAAFNKYKEQLGLNNTESDSIIEVKNQEKITKKKVIDTSTLQSLFMANETDLTATNAKNKELRDVMMEVEKKRRQGIKDQHQSLGLDERDSNKQKGLQKTKVAVKKSRDKNHKQALDNFYEASNLVPNNEDVYEQYGVSLHNVEKYNQSIVVLSLAENSKYREAEKQFYLGMNFYKLKDYENAIKHFDNVMKMNDKGFSPTAAFYKGSSLQELKRFDESNKAFQYVLDNSNDPNMDRQAEKFIENSIDLKAIEEKRSNRHFFDGVIGLIYDSNIILATNDAINTNTVQNESGWRLLLQGGYKYRPYYSESDEIGIKANITGMQSFDDSFGSSPEAEEADPYVVNLSVPWTHRGTLGKKGYFFELTPGYETILMDLDGSGRKAIVNSIKLDFDNTLVVDKNWVIKGDYSFSINDASILGDETSADSTGYGIKLSSIFVMNKDLERYLIPEFSYSINDAEGATFSYNRLDLGVTYTSSIFDSFLWNSRLGYFLANYENNRTDNNYSVSTGISYRVNQHWDWGLNGSYTTNDSDTNQYDKYSFITTMSFNY